MLSGVLKSVVGASLVAAFAGSLLANRPAPQAQQSGVSGRTGQAATGGSWYSGWFDGIELGKNKPAPQSPAPVQVATAPASGYGRVDLRADTGGQYLADVDIEGMRIPMLVDTGATLVSLTAEDAGRLGIRPAPSDYTLDIHTANGIAKAARVRLNEVRLETLSVRSVDAIVLPREVRGKSLLGMSFLKRLGGFEIARDTLMLRQ